MIRGKVLGIIGSTSLKPRPELILFIDNIFIKEQPDFFCSGGANGIDSIAEERALVYFNGDKSKLLIFLPRVNSWEHGFKPRNIKIAETCNPIYAIRDVDSTTFGSGWTSNHAKKIGKRVYRYYAIYEGGKYDIKYTTRW